MAQGSLFDLLGAPVRSGQVVWLGVRPGRRTEVIPVQRIDIDPDTGIAGDHYANRHTRTRQVTLIAREALAAIAAFLGRESIDPALLRRNVVIAGINPHALKSRQILLGTALLSVTGECHPCSRMEEALGPGGYNAVRGHGGLTARVLSAGSVHLGDPVVAQPPVGQPAGSRPAVVIRGAPSRTC